MIFARQEKEADQAAKPKSDSIKLTPVRRAIALLVQYPAIAELPQPPQELTNCRKWGSPFWMQLMGSAAQRPASIPRNCWNCGVAARGVAHWPASPPLSCLTVPLVRSRIFMPKLQDTLLGFIDRYFEQRIAQLQAKEKPKSGGVK